MKTALSKSSRGYRPKAASPSRLAGRKTAQVIDLVPSLIRIRSILVPVDFSETSKKALQYALRLAEQFGAKITLLHVVAPVASPDLVYHPLMLETAAVKRAAKDSLEALCRTMQVPSGHLEKTLVRYGNPFVEITEAARTLKVDLIVVSTHGYTGLKHVFLGSTAERVVRHAPCPVLTVREKEHEFI